VVRLDRVQRNILAEKPRVTRFPCEFDTPTIPTAASMEEEENVAPGRGLHSFRFPLKLSLLCPFRST
jgi:hypothetical protein